MFGLLVWFGVGCFVLVDLIFVGFCLVWVWVWWFLLLGCVFVVVVCLMVGFDLVVCGCLGFRGVAGLGCGFEMWVFCVGFGWLSWVLVR